MSAPIFTSASVKPSRFSYTVSCTTEVPSACVSATMSGCCQSVMKPGCTSVSTVTGFRGPPRRKRMPSSAMSNEPPTLRNTLRNVSISCCLAPPTKMSPSVASAALAHEAASLRSKMQRWS